MELEAIRTSQFHRNETEPLKSHPFASRYGASDGIATEKECDDSANATHTSIRRARLPRSEFATTLAASQCSTVQNCARPPICWQISKVERRTVPLRRH